MGKPMTPNPTKPMEGLLTPYLARSYPKATAISRAMCACKFWPPQAATSRLSVRLSRAM